MAESAECLRAAAFVFVTCVTFNCIFAYKSSSQSYIHSVLHTNTFCTLKTVNLVSYSSVENVHTEHHFPLALEAFIVGDFVHVFGFGFDYICGSVILCAVCSQQLNGHVLLHFVVFTVNWQLNSVHKFCHFWFLQMRICSERERENETEKKNQQNTSNYNANNEAVDDNNKRSSQTRSMNKKLHIVPMSYVCCAQNNSFARICCCFFSFLSPDPSYIKAHIMK